MMMNTVQDPSFRPSALFYQRKSLCKKPILKTNISIAWIVIKLAILLMSSRKRIDCSPNVSCYFLSHRARIGLHCGRWCWGSDQVSSTESVKYFAWCGLDFRIISWSGQVVPAPSHEGCDASVDCMSWWSGWTRILSDADGMGVMSFFVCVIES